MIWKSLLLLVGGLAAGLALWAFISPAGLVDLLVPSSGYKLVSDIAYGANPRQKLDLYIPDGLTAPAPVMLFFYGGSWQSGSKSLYSALGQAFASKGIIVAVADYRLFPEVRYPAFLDDAACAAVFVHKNISGYGGDPGRMFLAGHSAGAYLAVMLAAEPAFLRGCGGDPAWVRGVVGIAGPYDFLPLQDPALITIFGGDRQRDTQPINRVTGKRAPMFLGYGTADTTVLPRNSINLAAKLKTFGSAVEVKSYPGLSHITLLLTLVRGLRWRSTLRDDIVAFVDAIK